MSDVPDRGDESLDRYAFPLMAGGPLYRAMVRTHLSGSALQHLRRRLLVTLAIAWLPLLVLSFLEGHLWDRTGVGFLQDIASDVRWLIAMPLLLVAERAVHRHLLHAIPLFVDRGLVQGPQREQFAEAIAAGRRLLDSVPIELMLVVLVYAVAFTGVSPQAAKLVVGTWQGTLADGHRMLTWAGWWEAVVSVPLFQFLLVRWYFRLLVWWQFMWKVARIELDLQPMHPDSAAGLGFLSRISGAFAPFLLAQGAMASGAIADQIIYAGARLTDFRLEIAVAGVCLAIMAVGPMFAFVPVLSRAKQSGLRMHEALSMRYTREFTRKWCHGNPDDALLGNADVQSLADLGNSYAPVQRMLVLPIAGSTLALLLAAGLLPMLPLLLTMFSLKDIVQRVVSLIF